MKITILGSSGQIGAYLTTYLRDKGYEVFEYDIANGKEQDLTEIPNLALEHIIKSSDFIFFLAFDVGGSRYLKKYQHTFDFLNNNTRMMTNVFTLIHKYQKRFIFASSQMSNMGYSPYGTAKKMGELYTKALDGRVVKFWNVYGIEKDHEKSHVITDFIRRGFEEGDFEMLTDGTEERQFLYAEDCCEALEVVMEQYDEFTPDDPLHITSFHSSTIKEVALIIQGYFNIVGKSVTIKPAEAKDTVQLNKRNEADAFITKWWLPKTTLHTGIRKVFDEMRKDYES